MDLEGRESRLPLKPARHTTRPYACRTDLYMAAWQVQKVIRAACVEGKEGELALDILVDHSRNPAFLSFSSFALKVSYFPISFSILSGLRTIRASYPSYYLRPFPHCQPVVCCCTRRDTVDDTIHNMRPRARHQPCTRYLCFVRTFNRPSLSPASQVVLSAALCLILMTIKAKHHRAEYKDTSTTSPRCLLRWTSHIKCSIPDWLFSQSLAPS